MYSPHYEIREAWFLDFICAYLTLAVVVTFCTAMAYLAKGVVGFAMWLFIGTLSTVLVILCMFYLVRKRVIPWLYIRNLRYDHERERPVGDTHRSLHGLFNISRQQRWEDLPSHRAESHAMENGSVNF